MVLLPLEPVSLSRLRVWGRLGILFVSSDCWSAQGVRFVATPILSVAGHLWARIDMRPDVLQQHQEHGRGKGGKVHSVRDYCSLGTSSILLGRWRAGLQNSAGYGFLVLAALCIDQSGYHFSC